MIGDRLASLDPETGKRPQSRIGNAGNARSFVQRLKYEDQTRMWRYTQEMGLLNGNPPWSNTKLRDLGQSHRANFNLREGEGMADSAKQPYYDLVCQVPTLIQMEFDIEGVDPSLRMEWQNIFNEEYTDLLDGWPGYDQNLQLHQWQFVVFGVGPLFWPHSISWHCEAAKVRKVMVPQETKANVDDLERLVILHSYRADELEGYIYKGDEGDTNYNGWNIPLCKKAIIETASRETNQYWGTENWDLYQRAIRTGDIFHGLHSNERIYVASLFVREFGGKVSHYILTDSPLGTSEETYTSLEEEKGYLYVRKNKFEDFSQVICPFFFDVGPDGTWHSVKGLSPKIYDFCDVSNRTFCQALDGSVIGSGVTLEAQDANSLEETQIALVGGATVVSPGYKVVQTRIAESLNGAIQMRRELQNTLQSNTGSYRQRLSGENQEPTLGQAQMNWQAQGTLTMSAVNRYCKASDRFHTEVTRRLLDPAAQNENVPGGKEAKKFIERLLMRGLPEEILEYNKVRKVHCMRSLGYGSPQIRDMTTTQVMNMVPYMNEKGRNHALRMRAASLPGVGQTNVDALFPRIEEEGAPNVHTSKAVDENNALRQIGGQALVEDGQNHSIHFDTHMQDVMAHEQDPNAHMTEKLVHFEQAGGHMAQHLHRLRGDPTRKAEFKQKKKALDDLAKKTDQLGQQTSDWSKAQMKAQPKPQAPDTEGQAKMAKVHGELGLKSAKMKGEMALKAQKQKADIQLADQKTAAELKLERAKAVAGANKPQPLENKPGLANRPPRRMQRHYVMR